MFYRLVKFLVNIVFRIVFRVDVQGLENVPMEGRLAICANHINNLDPLMLSAIFPRQVFWMSKKELFDNKVLGFLLSKLGVFPVDRGDSDIAAIRNALRILKSGGVLGIFPEGTRVKEFDINNAKPGIGLLTTKSKSVVLPIFMESNYKLFNKVKIKIGKPIDLSQEESKDYAEISKNILRSIYDLK